MSRFLNEFLCSSLLICFLINVHCTIGYRIKKSASSNDNLEQADSSLDRININYDEYPVNIFNFLFIYQ